MASEFKLAAGTDSEGQQWVAPQQGGVEANLNVPVTIEQWTKRYGYAYEVLHVPATAGPELTVRLKVLRTQVPVDGGAILFWQARDLQESTSE